MNAIIRYFKSIEQNVYTNLRAVHKQVVSPYFRRNISSLRIIAKDTNTMTLGKFSYRCEEYLAIIKGINIHNVSISHMNLLQSSLNQAHA